MDELPLRRLSFQRRWTSLLAVAATVVAGCAGVAPRPGPADAIADMPVAWSSVGAGGEHTLPSLANWWQRFDDPTLWAMVTLSLSANTNVVTARASVAEARALRDVARAALWPTLDASASIQRASAAGQKSVNTLQTGVSGAWAPDVFGAKRRTVDASEAVLEAASERLGNVRVSVAAEAGLAYIGLRSAQTRLAIAKQNLAVQEDTLQITNWRQQAGLVTELESAQARAAVAQTRALLPAFQTLIEQNAHSLAVLTGQPPAALSRLLAVAQPVPQAGEDTAAGIPADTLRQRADVRAAENDVTAAFYRVSAAKAARAPSFELGGSLGLSAATLGMLGDGASVVRALMASVAVPVFDGGRARAQVRVEQALLLAVRSAYKATVLAALQQVEDALVALRDDRLRLADLRASAEAAAIASLLARRRYGSGLIDFQVVLDTQRTELGAEDTVAAVLADIGADQIRLYTALGGGWQEAPASHDGDSPSDAKGHPYP